MSDAIDITPEAVEELSNRIDVWWEYQTGHLFNEAASTLRALSAANEDAYVRGFSAGQAALKNAGEFVVIDSPELAELRAALTASQAETAAAYEAAAHILDMWATNLRNMNFPDTAPIVEQCAAMIRVITPVDSKAALDRPIVDFIEVLNGRATPSSQLSRKAVNDAENTFPR